MNIYEVTTKAGGRKTTVTAESADKAKRKACKEWNISPSCPWCGLSNMTAKKIKGAC